MNTYRLITTREVNGKWFRETVTVDAESVAEARSIARAKTHADMITVVGMNGQTRGQRGSKFV